MSRPSRSHSIITTYGPLILLGLLAYLYWSDIGVAVERFTLLARKTTAPAAVTAAAMPSLPPQCHPDAFPANGAVLDSDPAVLRRSDVLFSGLEIRNQRPYPILAYVTVAEGDRTVVALAIAAGQQVQASLPVGRYRLHFLAGALWCNPVARFLNGRRINVQNGFELEPGKTAMLTLTPVGLGDPERFQIAAEDRGMQPAPSQFIPPAPQPVAMGPDVIGQGYAELQQRQDGHYYSAGLVNSVPVIFLLDTGATITSISQGTAARAGVRDCQPRQFNTANGAVMGCIARVPEMHFANFILKNFEVAVMPNMASDALLGMNVLRSMRIEQRDGVLRISGW